MLRTNLSTRPFYNERIVHVLLALAAVVVVALTAYNAIRIVALSRQNTEFSSLISRDRAEAERLTGEARRIRAGIDQRALKATVDAAGSANRLIDQRTFSWTEFFNQIESTLPPDVMLTAVTPSFDRARSVVKMTVLARQTADVDEFIQRLEATGAFRDVLPTSNEETDEGLYRVLLQAEYLVPAVRGGTPAGAPSTAPARPQGQGGAAP